jgi:hypothetical protein
MSMPVPVVGVAGGPEWAELLNACLAIIDSHSHVSGSGVQITPSAININGALPMNGYDLTTIRSSRFTSQSSPLALAADLGCVYVSGEDLYYNDTNGNQVRLTQSGAVAGTPGSIANLVSPASATYVAGSSTFVWESGANTPANMDLAALILRNLSASSNGLTLQPPAAMGSNYTITLPTLPASQRVLSMDASGNMGAGVAGAIVTADMADQQVTQAKKEIRSTGATVGAGGFAISSSSGNFSTSSSGETNVTNLSVTITSLGNPIRIACISDAQASLNASGFLCNAANGSFLRLRRGGTNIQQSAISTSWLPPSALDHMDVVAAGTYTYVVSVDNDTATSTFATYLKLIAYEL